MQASSSRPRVRHQLRRKGLLGITPRDQKGLGRTWSAASSRVLHYDARTCFSLISRGPYVVLWIGQIPVSHPILSEAKNQQRRGLQLYRHTLPPYSRARGELGIKVLRMTKLLTGGRDRLPGRRHRNRIRTVFFLREARRQNAFQTRSIAATRLYRQP
jgi:hypothetical protein